VDEYRNGKFVSLSPHNIEELFIAMGEKEKNDDVQIVMTIEFIADLCMRFIRIEDQFFDDEEPEEESGEEWEW
jgi:hypothetical protein